MLKVAREHAERRRVTDLGFTGRELSGLCSVGFGNEFGTSLEKYVRQVRMGSFAYTKPAGQPLQGELS